MFGRNFLLFLLHILIVALWMIICLGDIVFQIVKLDNYDEEQFDDTDFYIAFSLAELLLDSNNQ